MRPRWPLLEQRGWRLRRRIGWCFAVAALTPKCALCLIAYAGLGARAARAGRGLCGGASGMSGLLARAGAWLGAMIWLLLAALPCRGRGTPARRRHATSESAP